MKIDRTRPEPMAPHPALHPALHHRSEAFAEDLEGLLPGVEAVAGPEGSPGRPYWLFLLPLAVVLIGSASALAWA